MQAHDAAKDLAERSAGMTAEERAEALYDLARTFGKDIATIEALIETHQALRRLHERGRGMTYLLSETVTRALDVTGAALSPTTATGLGLYADEVCSVLVTADGDTDLVAVCDRHGELARSSTDADSVEGAATDHLRAQ